VYEDFAAHCAEGVVTRDEVKKLGLLDKNALSALDEASDEQFEVLVRNLQQIAKGLGYA